VAESPEPIRTLVKKEAEPQRDPIVSRSTSAILLICTVLLIISAGWALYDEGFGQRPWRGMQQQFVKRYSAYLKSIRKDAGKSEAEVKETPEYQQLNDQAKASLEKVKADIAEKDKRVAQVQAKLDAVTEPFQNQRGRIVVITYKLETAPSDFWRKRYRSQLDEKKKEVVTVDLPPEGGKPVRQKMNFAQLEQTFNELRDEKAKALGEKAELLKEPSELARKRDEYLKNHVSLLPQKSIDDLLKKNENAFDYTILGHQINVNEFAIVDRCEICHLGTREPLTIKASDMAPSGPGKKPDELAGAFVSHPRRELLQTHNPEKFGCSACHGGNGRATTSVVKAHGLNPFWLHPLFHKENTEAGCQMCHANDRVTQGADTLNLGKDLFYQRGCVGCHRMEAFDRESDALTNARQQISQLQDQIVANERQARLDTDASANAGDDTAEVQRLLAHAESLRVTNSQLAARIDELNLQTRYLQQDQKKIGPNLKDARLKLRKDWIPLWLHDPQAFRPGTKMPTFWRFKIDGEEGEEDLKAVAAYLWQSGFDGKAPAQAKGDDKHGKELFESRGCLACHSIGEGDSKMGGTFAANLTKVGEKANYDYIVRWIYNPRERWAPYCPKEKRDLTPEDYKNHGLPFVFDTELHSKCPNDGAELQVQNMTVMPNLRLSEQDARDVATYLFSLSSAPAATDVSFMDDPKLIEDGKAEIKQYGCAGCHEIKGFEEEQRIGKELTTEGATPLERLDFALLTQDAEYGRDPLKLHPKDKETEWYNHRGFFEHKLTEPGIYDTGKSQYLEPKDRLRMPKPYLTDEWRTGLTTLLLGSLGAEGANVPAALFYNPPDQRRQDIQNGWWVIKKYNCMGCHVLQPGQQISVYNNSDQPTMTTGAVLTSLSFYQGQKEFLPPQLTSEGARVDPDWLMKFLKDPSMMQAGEKPTVPPSAPTTSPAAPSSPTAAATPGAGTKPPAVANDQSGGRLMPQPGANRNGVRPYLQVHMPTFNFSPNELRVLVRFFMAVSSQNDPYIKEPMDPMTETEKSIARNMFVSGTPCLKCHITGEPTHDAKAIAPNFLLASERLKPEWTFRWLLDPAQIAPGTAMPTGLFRKEGDRWVVNLPNPPTDVANYHGDHARLLVRYMFLITPDEQRRLLSATPAPPPVQPASPPAPQKTGRNKSGAGLSDRAGHHAVRRRSHAARPMTRAGPSGRQWKSAGRAICGL
jgi:cytochrome c2